MKNDRLIQLGHNCINLHGQEHPIPVSPYLFHHVHGSRRFGTSQATFDVNYTGVVVQLDFLNAMLIFTRFTFQ